MQAEREHAHEWGEHDVHLEPAVDDHEVGIVIVRAPGEYVRTLGVEGRHTSACHRPLANRIRQLHKHLQDWYEYDSSDLCPH
jgi:hypothetical protein